MTELVLEKVAYTYPEEGNRLRRRGDLADINLTMTGSATAAVVGSAGSGNNTLLNLIAGRFQPTEGRLLWKGHPIDGPGTDRGVVFHQSALYPWQSVAENIEFGLKGRKMGRRERKRRVAEYLERFGLTRLAAQPVYQVNDYHYLVLVSFARCLACEPDLVLIGDDPLDQINDRFRGRLQTALMKYWRDKAPMLFMITSDVQEAMLMASEIYIMSGRPGRLVKQYASPFAEKARAEGVEAVRHLPEFREMRRDILRHVI